MRKLIPITLLTCLQSLNAFTWTQETKVNGKVYVEKTVQPWFKHKHLHSMVSPEDKENSSFGKHYIPPDEPYTAPYWTDEEKKYLHCMDLLCVCGYFNGTTSNNNCVLPTGDILKRAIRKEIRQLSDAERIAFETAVNELKKSGDYNRISRVHKYSGVHSGPAFVIWHREFLKRVELVVRRQMPPPHDFGIPFWDSTLDALIPEQKDTVMFTEELLGEVDKDNWVVTGPYKNWTSMEGRPAIRRMVGHDHEGEFLSPARVDWIADNEDFRAVMACTMPLTTCPTYSMLDDRFLEYSHDYVHFFVGGDMGRSHSSSNDIIFCLHHSMIDYMWEMWRQKHQNRTTRETKYHVSDERCFPPWHFIDSQMAMLDPYTNADGLSNKYTDNMYEFAPRPTCSKEKRDCGSKFLFCHVDGETAQCMTKIKFGGNCSGFEDFPSCYRGKCDRGICSSGDSKKREIGVKKRQGTDGLYM